MKVTSVCFGFATNSSSSHSVVFSANCIDRKTAAETYQGQGEVNFGWSWEDYRDIDSIINYGLFLSGVLRNIFDGSEFQDRWGDLKGDPEGMRALALKSDQAQDDEDFREILKKIDFLNFMSGYGIDHQSNYRPDWMKGNGSLERFWSFVENCQMVITGNDNSDEPPEQYKEYFEGEGYW